MPPGATNVVPYECIIIGAGPRDSPAIGVRPRTGLAEALGLRTDESGCLDADVPFEAEIPGLYSAGDIVEGLDQIAVAMAHGAVTATKAHNWLRQRDGETSP